MRNNGGLLGPSWLKRGREELADSECILMTEPTGLANELEERSQDEQQGLGPGKLDNGDSTY